MNENKVVVNRFSNPDSKQKYESQWADEPEIYNDYYLEGLQCGGCAFYASFNSDYGLCCNKDSRHHLETVFEHFTCSKQVNEGWNEHSFHDFTEVPSLYKSKLMKFNIPEEVYDAIMIETDGDRDELYLRIVNLLYLEFIQDDS